MTGNHPLYDAAVTADEVFSAECKRIFGARACDMRYRPDQWPNDRALLDAAATKVVADRVWLNVMRSAL